MYRLGDNAPKSYVVHRRLTVNDGVADDFCHGSFGIVRKFFAVVGFFPPALVRIVSHECDGILQLADDAAFQFGIVKSLTESACHCEAVPAGAEDS